MWSVIYTSNFTGPFSLQRVSAPGRFTPDSVGPKNDNGTFRVKDHIPSFTLVAAGQAPEMSASGKSACSKSISAFASCLATSRQSAGAALYIATQSVMTLPTSVQACMYL